MDCPVNESMWKKRSAKFPCHGDDDYHCLVKEDETSIMEKCVGKSRLIEGQCPIFSEHGYIHWRQCNSSECPNTTYLSNEVYNYPVCLQKKNVTFTTSKTGGSNRKYPGVIIGLTTGFLISLIIVVLVAAVCYWKRRSNNTGEPFADVEEMKPLTEAEDNQAVTAALKDLQKTDILIIHGKLGNGVSNTGKTVIQSYASQNSEWDCKHLNYSDNLDSSLTERKIVFVDGWFGIWNPNPSEEKRVKGVLENIQQKMLSVEQCKVVIGLRTDVFERYKTIFKSAGKYHLDLDSSRMDKHEETERHLESALISSSRKCKRRKCGCKNLILTDIEQNYDDIGVHLKIDILTIHHDLIHVFLKSGDLLQTLVSHFDELKGKNKTLYGCLMYIVAQGKYKVGDDIDHKVKNAFHLEVTKHCFEKCKNLTTYTKSLSRSNLVNVQDEPADSNCSWYVFQHVFLYLCAFHSLFRLHPKQVMEYCNIDAVLQIVRPYNFENEHKFCVKANNEAINYFYKHVIKRDKDLEESLKDHPLVKYAVGTGV